MKIIKYIGYLINYIRDNDTSNIEMFEDLVSTSVSDAAAEDLFYDIPFENISRIVQLAVEKEKRIPASTMKEIISRLSDNGIKETPLLLNVLDNQEMTRDEVLEVLSCFSACPVCMLLNKFENSCLPVPLEESHFGGSKSRFSIDFPPVDCEPKDFTRDIFKAAAIGDLNSLQYLIERKGFHTSSMNKDGFTPLHFAADYGELLCIQYLVEAMNASTECTTKNESTPLHIACQSGRLHVVKYLIEKCQANFNATNKMGLTPLHFAAFHNHVPVMQYLINVHGADYEKKSFEGETPLLSAAKGCSLQAIKYLIEQVHADKNAQTNEGKNLLDIAQEAGYKPSITYIKDNI